MAGVSGSFRRCSSKGTADREEETMAGQFGLRRCSSKDSVFREEESQMIKACSDKRKTEAAPATCETKSKAEQAEAGCLDGEKVAEVTACEGAPAAAKKLIQLPDEEVQWVLARKREYLTPGISSAKGIEAHNYLSDCFTDYQDWVREQYNANGGVVMVGEEFLEHRAKNLQMVQDLIDQMDHISFSELGFEISDRYSDFYESDGEEEGKEEEKEEEEEKEREEVVQELDAN